MTNEDMAVKLGAVEHRAESNTRRIEKLELQTEAIQSLATSVAVMVEEQSHQTEAMQRIEKNVEKLDGKLDTKVGELDGRIEDIEKKPAKRWEALVEKIIWGVVAALLGFVLAQVGL